MVEDRIGYRYAKSLFDLTVEQGDVENAGKDMALLRDTISENRDLSVFLKSPLISSSRKEKIIDRIFKGQFQTASAEKLVSMIVRKGREMYLPQVAEAFLRLYDQQQNIKRGQLTSAVALTDKEVAEITATMEKQTGSHLVLTREVDPSIIGGFMLKIDDNLFDGSVSGAIRRLKQQFAPGQHA